MVSLLRRIGVFLFILAFISLVSGQIGDIEGKIDEGVENLERNVSKVKEFGQKEKWEFIGVQWKEFLLKNKMIAGIDAFFTKINLVFVVLFGIDWSLSLTMFFVFFLWLFTLISITKYFYVDSKLLRFVYSLLCVTVLAQLHFFSSLSSLASELVFLKVSPLWRTFFIFIIFLFIFLWYKLNSIFAFYFEKRRKNLIEQKARFNEKKIEKVVKGIESGSS